MPHGKLGTGIQELSGLQLFYKSKIIFKVSKEKRGLFKNKTPVFLTLIYFFHIKPMPLIGFNYHKALLEGWLKYYSESCTPAAKVNY